MFAIIRQSFAKVQSRAYSSANVHYDIVITGGGMIGTTLACLLAQNPRLSDRKILLLEGTKKPSWKPQEKYSKRVSSINPQTVSILKKIKAWNMIEENKCAPVKKLQVWDACSDSMITFCNDDMSENISYIVENNLIVYSVMKQLDGLENITVLHDAKVKDYVLPQSSHKNVEILLENGDVYTCSLLLGADGAGSRVRRAMGVHHLAWDYRQTSVVATVKLAETTNNVVAWQRFLPTGPVALLPLADSLSSLVWTTTPEQAKALVKMPEEHFVDALNEAIWKQYPRESIIDQASRRLDQVLESIGLTSNAVRQLPPSAVGIEEGSKAAFPLGFGHASSYVSHGVALLGDAAHRVHPLAGLGVNLGFGDVLCLSEVLGEAVHSGQHIGSEVHLKRYESARQRHNLPIMLTIDGLHKLYGTDFTPVVLLRSLGVQIAHAIAPLKRTAIELSSS